MENRKVMNEEGRMNQDKQRSKNQETSQIMSISRPKLQLPTRRPYIAEGQYLKGKQEVFKTDLSQ